MASASEESREIAVTKVHLALAKAQAEYASKRLDKAKERRKQVAKANAKMMETLTEDIDDAQAQLLSSQSEVKKAAASLKATEKRREVIKSSTKDKKKRKKDKPPSNSDDTDTASLPINNPSIISHDCPSWTLIIDTCSLLQQNGIQSINNIIRLAKTAISNNTNQTTNQLHTPLYEPISIVIPYVVWGELDYQSKLNKVNSSKLEEGEAEKNETNAHTARRAIRMLHDELKLSQQIDRVGYSSVSLNNVPSSRGGVLHSQSLVESNEAADKYPSRLYTNDDYILACALKENEKYKQKSNNTFGTIGSISSAVAGGVVVITLDNNLSCKCLANDLKVDSPSSFVEYHEKRMESLKQRLKVSTKGEAKGKENNVNQLIIKEEDESFY